MHGYNLHQIQEFVECHLPIVSLFNNSNVESYDPNTKFWKNASSLYILTLQYSFINEK